MMAGAAALPVVGQVERAREMANRSACAANLRGIAQSFVVYAAENNDEFPAYPGKSLTAYDASVKGEASKGKTADDALEEGFKTGQYANNPGAVLWILVLRGQVSPKGFVCKSDPFGGAATAVLKEKAYRMNFDSAKGLSYSVAYAWGVQGAKGEMKPGEWWKNTTDASLAILSDVAPYVSGKAEAGEVATRPAGKEVSTSRPSDPLVLGAETSAAGALNNSPNHLFDGQNVGFADGHAEFARRPDVGQRGDNLWTVTVEGEEKVVDAGLLPGAIGTHKEPFDVVMVPTRTAKGELK
jgi:prepilin-type processing-associated H-X9-DG protein